MPLWTILLLILYPLLYLAPGRCYLGMWCFCGKCDHRVSLPSPPFCCCRSCSKLSQYSLAHAFVKYDSDSESSISQGAARMADKEALGTVAKLYAISLAGWVAKIDNY